MDSYQLFGFVGILRESLKVLLKSRKLMLYIASISLLLQSLLFLSNTLSMAPFLRDMALKVAILLLDNPNSPDFTKLRAGIKEDVKILIGIELVYLLFSFIVSVFSTTATIFLSATTYCEKSLTFKKLLLGVGKSWKRPLITCFYTTLFTIVFIFGLMAISIPLVMIFNSPVATKAILIVLGVLGLGLWFYISVAWVVAVVVSVTEENCYGIQALVKAGGLVKGKRLDGTVLILLFNLVAMIEFPVFKMMGAEKSPSARILMGLFVVTFSSLISMFMMINFTVLYFHCKKNHGEEIELQGSVEYSKLPTTLLFKEDIP